MPGSLKEKLDYNTTRTDAHIYTYKWSSSSEEYKHWPMFIDRSPNFILNNQKWFIYLSPVSPSDKTVSLTVCRITKDQSSNESISIGLLSILNDKHEKIVEYSKAFKIPSQQKFYIECFNFKSETEFLPLLVNDRLQVSLELFQKSDAMVDKKNDKLEEMYLANKFSDVKLLAKDGKELLAHKIILASRVPYFEAMFQCDMKESTSNTVAMADVEFNVLKELLRFVYTGKVENMGDVFEDLIIAADKYLMEGLKNHCEKYLCDAMCVETVLEILELAHKCNADEVKTRSIEFIKENVSEIVRSNKFLEMTAGDTKCVILGDILRALFA